MLYHIVSQLGQKGIQREGNSGGGGQQYRVRVRLGGVGRFFPGGKVGGAKAKVKPRVDFLEPKRNSMDRGKRTSGGIW